MFEWRVFCFVCWLICYVYILYCSKDEAAIIEESYKTFSMRTNEIINRVETIKHELIDAERLNDRDRLGLLEKDMVSVLNEIEIVRSLGSDLSIKSEKHLSLIEAELRALLRAFDDLNRRYKYAQVSEARDSLVKNRK
jgi:hypothetical protein